MRDIAWQTVPSALVSPSTSTSLNTMQKVENVETSTQNFVRVGTYLLQKQCLVSMTQNNAHLLLSPFLINDVLKAVVDNLEDDEKERLMVCPSLLSLSIHEEGQAATALVSSPTLRVGTIAADKIGDLKSTISLGALAQQSSSSLVSSTVSVMDSAQDQQVSSSCIKLEYSTLTPTTTQTTLKVTKNGTDWTAQTTTTTLDAIRVENRTSSKTLIPYKDWVSALDSDTVTVPVWGMVTVVSPVKDEQLKVVIDLSMDVVLTQYVETTGNANAGYDQILVATMQSEWVELPVGTEEEPTEFVTFPSLIAMKEASDASTAMLKLKNTDDEQVFSEVTNPDGVKVPWTAITTKEYNGTTPKVGINKVNCLVCKCILELTNDGDTTAPVKVQVLSGYQKSGKLVKLEMHRSQESGAISWQAIMQNTKTVGNNTNSITNIFSQYRDSIQRESKTLFVSSAPVIINSIIPGHPFFQQVYDITSPTPSLYSEFAYASSFSESIFNYFPDLDYSGQNKDGVTQFPTSIVNGILLSTADGSPDASSPKLKARLSMQLILTS